MSGAYEVTRREREKVGEARALALAEEYFTSISDHLGALS